ncbi:hypothetical protein ACFQZ1_10320 [Bacillus sp. CGMCC 1.60114]|uniref:hypothetical protein n=1 Tax=unclassified Bacillus (in: firmicutes) TaxID=185979 RepID=UPI00362E7343
MKIKSKIVGAAMATSLLMGGVTSHAAINVGWTQVNGAWYLNDASGVVKRGWVQDGGNWYLLDQSTGAMKKGWVQDSGNWYLLDQSTGV